VIRRALRNKRPSFLAKSLLVFTTALLLVTQLGWLAQSGLSPSSLSTTTNQALSNNRFGIAHISYGSDPVKQQRYDLAKGTGAGWDRWALYWTDVERESGKFNFSAIDATVAADQANGFKTLATLMSTPGWATTAPENFTHSVVPRLGQKTTDLDDLWSVDSHSGGSSATFAPKNLYAPIFSDGTDTPGTGKTINPDNYWARFVFQTASRYKGKIDHWEIWNEPDYRPTAATGWFGFWSGSLDEYRRLLKVGYISVKSANPSATVVMGGMAFWLDQTFFPRLLDIILRDGDSKANNYYFDATSWHWYSRPLLLYDQTFWVKSELSKRKLQDKGIWITETGLPVCNDPGTEGKPFCSPGGHRGTLENQASFVIQAASYALAAGVDRIFFFQLFDDAVGPFEYYGLIRNDGSVRPAYSALQIVTGYFRDAAWAYRTPSRKGQLELVNIYLADGRRTRVVWDYSGNPVALQTPVGVPADTPTAALVQYDTTTTGINGANYFYLRLAPANLDDEPGSAVDYIVGGPPQLLIESGVSAASGNVNGAIRTQYSQPVASASTFTSTGSRTSTDGSGKFSFALPPGLYDVDAQAQGYLSPGPVMGVPVWSNRTTDVTMLLTLLRNTYLPLIINKPLKR